MRGIWTQTNLLIGLSAWFPSSKPPPIRLAGLYDKVNPPKPEQFPLSYRSYPRCFVQLLRGFSFSLPFLSSRRGWKNRFLIFFISHKGQREKRKSRVSWCVFDRESRIDWRDRERARVKALEVNRGFFSTLTSEIKAAGRITVALDARRPQSVYSHLSVCLWTWLVSDLSSTRIRKERASERMPFASGVEMKLGVVGCSRVERGAAGK